MEDVLGTGTLLKKIIKEGEKSDEEAPREFFATVDIETKLEAQTQLIQSECHRDFFINIDSDLFSGLYIAVPLMNIGEQSLFIFDPKFCYGKLGVHPHIPPESKLECLITLKSRIPKDEFIENFLHDNELFSVSERLKVASRKKERGNFWYIRCEYSNAISVYKSSKQLLKSALTPDDMSALSSKAISSCDDLNSKSDTKLEILKSLIAVRNNLAACYIKTGDLSKAEKNIDKLLKFDPTNTKALFRLATIFSKRTMNQEAVRILRSLLELDPTNKAALDMFAYEKDKAMLAKEKERNLCRRMFSSS